MYNTCKSESYYYFNKITYVTHSARWFLTGNSFPHINHDKTDKVQEYQIYYVLIEFIVHKVHTLFVLTSEQICTPEQI